MISTICERCREIINNAGEGVFWLAQNGHHLALYENECSGTEEGDDERRFIGSHVPITLPTVLQSFVDHAKRAELAVTVEEQQESSNRSHQLLLEVCNPHDPIGAYLYMIASRGSSGRWSTAAHYAPSITAPLIKIAQRDVHFMMNGMK